MQPRLMRSRNEVIIAGVCGGIGEYFGVDPVIVRLIFVLLTLTSGVGLLLYPVLWAVMPKAPAPSMPPGDPARAGRSLTFESRQGDPALHAVAGEHAPAGQHRRSGTTYAAPPPPAAYNFDPVTGEPLRELPPATGQTVHLGSDPIGAPPAPGAPRRRRWPVLGIILVGIGLVALADAMGLPVDFVIPALMIAAGVLLIARRS